MPIDSSNAPGPREEAGAIPAEVLKKVRLIEIGTRRLVNSVLAGQYHSAFKGQGMEAAEVREYVPGDEVRAIDWNVTARMGHPFVKIFSEERELTTVLAVDISGSLGFGSGERLKREVAVEIAALIAFAALRNNDRVGLLLFTDQIELFLPPKKGRGHGLRVIRELITARPKGRGTNVALALQHLRRLLTRKAVIFVLSDFVCQPFERPLRGLAGRHDVACLDVSDRREEAIPPVGLLEIEDPETGDLLAVDASDPGFRKAFEKNARARTEALATLIRKAGADFARVDAAGPYEAALVSLFRARQSRRGWTGRG